MLLVAFGFGFGFVFPACAWIARRWKNARVSRKPGVIKARVIKAGTVVPRPGYPGKFIISDFWLDTSNGAAAFAFDSRGNFKMGGYSVAELREIAKRPSEFEVADPGAGEEWKNPDL